MLLFFCYIADFKGMNLAKLTWQGHPAVLWDLGGQIKMRSLWERYYEEADCVVFLVDAADLDRLGEAKRAFGKLSGNVLI